MTSRNEAIEEFKLITTEAREKVGMLFSTISSFDAEFGKNILSPKTESTLLGIFEDLNNFEKILSEEKDA